MPLSLSRAQVPRPPRAAARWLLYRLGTGDETRAIVGDLSEDFVQLADSRGYRAAQLWFWWEALLLSVTLRVGRGRGHVADPASNNIPNEPVSRSRPPWRSPMTPLLHPSTLVQDARYAARAVRKDFGLFMFAVCIVGLGVGACTAIFSVLSPLLLRALPFDEPERLVWIANDGEGGMSAVTSRASNLRDFRELSRAFDGLTGYNAFFEQGGYNYGGDEQAQRLVGVGVAGNFLEVLGVQPVVGRGFNAEESRWGGPNAVVLSHGFWQRQFAGETDVVGRSILLNNDPSQVVGVLPADFDFAAVFAPHTRVDFLRVFPISDETDRWGNTLSIIGRLAPGVTAAQAQEDLDRVILGLQEADPERWGLGAVVDGLQHKIAGPFRSALLLLAIAAGAVMLIVCVNLSSLLLAKSSRRSREMAVRSALGASRLRLVRQMLIESSILSGGGALLGLGVAWTVTRFVSGLQGLRVPLLSEVAVDGQALLFTVALACAVGVAVGIIPALQVSIGGEASMFRGTRRSMSASRHSTRFREILVVGEVALACMLLVVGGLLLRSFQNVLDVDLGFSPDQVVTWQLSTSRSFDEHPELVAHMRQIAAGVEALPGVSSVGLSDAIPLGRNRTWPLGAPGYTYENDQGHFSTFPHMVDAGYLRTLDIPLVAGRHFTPEDTHDRPYVAILNETAAAKVFHGEDPLGRTVIIAGDETEVVGIVKDIRHRSLEVEAGPQMYLPMAQIPAFSTLDLVVRSSVAAPALAPSVSTAIRALDPSIPTREYHTLSGVVDRSVSPRKLTLQLLVAFAATALLLAALGIYGVLSYSVAERIPEIGIRMALGETGFEVLRRVVGKTVLLASVGLAFGAAGSYAASRGVASMLYGVQAGDPWTFVVMAAMLLGVAVLAGFLPALRAARTNVASVLRTS